MTDAPACHPTLPFEDMVTLRAVESAKFDTPTLGAFIDRVPATIDTAVVFCVYKRTERFERTLTDLVAANEAAGLPIIVWNNNPEASACFESVAARVGPSLRLHLHHAQHNLCGCARFVVSSVLARRFSYSIYLDDDQTIAKEAIAEFLKERDARTISSVGSFIYLPREQWIQKFGADKVPASEQERDVLPVHWVGDNADYCGTGGMLTPNAPFIEADFWNRFRIEWRLVEDSYLSTYAKQKLHYMLKHSRAMVRTDRAYDSDEHAMWRTAKRGSRDAWWRKLVIT